jgi:hypothetical protein
MEACPSIRQNHIRSGYPIGSMVLPYMVTFTINIPQMLAYINIPYMDPMGYLDIVSKTTWKNPAVLLGPAWFHAKSSVNGLHCAFSIETYIYIMYIILNYIYLYIYIEIDNRNLKNSTNDPAKRHVLLPALITQYAQPQPLMSTKKI